MDYIKKAIWGTDPKEQVCGICFDYLELMGLIQLYNTNIIVDEENKPTTT